MLRRTTPTGVLLSLVLLEACASASRPEADDPQAAHHLQAATDLQAIVEEIRAKREVPALAVSVGASEGAIASAAAGVRIAGRPGPVTIDDRFHIGSVTKPFTATMIATLVEDGLLEWDTTVAEALPECAPTLRDVYRHVTLAQLLSHESGLPAFDRDEDFEGIDREGSPREQLSRFSCQALEREPVAAPGTEFHYSNAGFSVAAAMAESRAGEPWAELVRERVLAPLELGSAGFGWPAKTGLDAPWGHWAPDDGESAPHDPDGEYQLPVAIAPAGDLHLSTPDLARFLVDHLRALQGKPALLEPATARAMHTRRIRSGLGWGVRELLGFEPVSTFHGSADTFITIVVIIPELDRVFAVSVNEASESADAAAKEVLETLIQREKLGQGAAQTSESNNSTSRRDSMSGAVSSLTSGVSMTSTP